MSAGKEVVTLVRAIYFSCAHTYNPSPSKFREPQQMGHNFRLEVYLSGQVDAESGMIVNLRDVDAWLKKLVEPLDHHHLEADVDFFKTHAPSPENIAIYCYENLLNLIPTASANQVRLQKVRLYETPSLWIDYSG